MVAGQAGAEQFGQMHRLPAVRVTLFDLGAATEAVGEHDVVGVGVAQGGEQYPLGACLGDLVVAGLEAKVAGQAAAAGVEKAGIDAGPAQYGLIGRCR